MPGPSPGPPGGTPRRAAPTAVRPRNRELFDHLELEHVGIGVDAPGTAALGRRQRRLEQARASPVVELPVRDPHETAHLRSMEPPDTGYGVVNHPPPCAPTPALPLQPVTLVHGGRHSGSYGGVIRMESRVRRLPGPDHHGAEHRQPDPAPASNGTPPVVRTTRSGRLSPSGRTRTTASCRSTRSSAPSPPPAVGGLVELYLLGPDQTRARPPPSTRSGDHGEVAQPGARPAFVDLALQDVGLP